MNILEINNELRDLKDFLNSSTGINLSDTNKSIVIIAINSLEKVNDLPKASDFKITPAEKKVFTLLFDPKNHIPEITGNYINYLISTGLNKDYVNNRLMEFWNYINSLKIYAENEPESIEASAKFDKYINEAKADQEDSKARQERARREAEEAQAKQEKARREAEETQAKQEKARKEAKEAQPKPNKFKSKYFR